MLVSSYSIYFWFAFKVGLIILMGLYFIVTLIALRQVNLLSETLVTQVSPILRWIALILAGASLMALIIFIGILF